ncbi:uncharacterized protein DS421_2g57310 [Arachis hypogaea]|nr:uncharacterized protein DS421_2g57310 [Arachis hypogaea]
MATNVAHLKLFFCILFVAFLFTSDARSGTIQSLSIITCDSKTVQNCNSSECKKSCVEIKHYEVGRCIPTRGCCCYNNDRLT